MDSCIVIILRRSSLYYHIFAFHIDLYNVYISVVYKYLYMGYVQEGLVEEYHYKMSGGSNLPRGLNTMEGLIAPPLSVVPYIRVPAGGSPPFTHHFRGASL